LYYQERTAGDKVRGEACMNLLERKVINSLVDPVLNGSEEGKKRKRRRK
jgi:hypothetical protein